MIRVIDYIPPYRLLNNRKGKPVNSCPQPASGLGSSLFSRFVLASTQELHEKVAILTSRVRELEDGLRASHAQQSQEPHPLLAEDLLLIKTPLQREGLAQMVAGNELAQTDPTSDITNTFGSLQISDTGRTSYFGHATSSWVRGTGMIPRGLARLIYTFPLFSISTRCVVVRKRANFSELTRAPRMRVLESKNWTTGETTSRGRFPPRSSLWRAYSPLHPTCLQLLTQTRTGSTT